MIIVNKPGEIIVSSHQIIGRIEDDKLTIDAKGTHLTFRRGESINPRIIILPIQGERVVNLQFVPVASEMSSVYMPDYETADKFLSFIEDFIKGAVNEFQTLN